MTSEKAKVRVMLFIDFWNFTLNMKKLDETFLIDWFKIPSAFMRYLQNSQMEGVSHTPLEYVGCDVVGSYGPGPRDASLRNWSRTTLQKVEGLTSIFLPRQKMEQGPVCTGPQHHEIQSCPHCQSPMSGHKEKGVDSTLVTLMLQKAWMDNYDIAVLVSSDRDFIPTVEFLRNRNKKCIQAGFRGSGIDLARNCWASIDIDNIREDFRRKKSAATE